jgi:hypothetical protein
MCRVLAVIVLLLTPAAPHAQSAPAQAALSYASGPADDGTGRHAVRGIVKAVGASSLVISRPGRSRGDLVFMLTSATDLDGMLLVGATVSVRYRTEGDSLVAMAVTVHPLQRAVPALQPSP